MKAGASPGAENAFEPDATTVAPVSGNVCDIGTLPAANGGAAA